jgi:hypothetical protein
MNCTGLSGRAIGFFSQHTDPPVLFLDPQIANKGPVADMYCALWNDSFDTLTVLIYVLNKALSIMPI